jgi:hypothetical protein
MQCYVVICCIYVTVTLWRCINSVRLGDNCAWRGVHPMSHRLWVVRIWPMFSCSYHPPPPRSSPTGWTFHKDRLLSPACHSIFHCSCPQLITSNLEYLNRFHRPDIVPVLFHGFPSPLQISDVFFWGPFTLDLREIRKLRMSFLSCY